MHAVFIFEHLSSLTWTSVTLSRHKLTNPASHPNLHKPSQTTKVTSQSQKNQKSLFADPYLIMLVNLIISPPRNLFLEVLLCVYKTYIQLKIITWGLSRIFILFLFIHHQTQGLGYATHCFNNWGLFFFIGLATYTLS